MNTCCLLLIFVYVYLCSHRAFHLGLYMTQHRNLILKFFDRTKAILDTVTYKMYIVIHTCTALCYNAFTYVPISSQIYGQLCMCTGMCIWERTDFKNTQRKALLYMISIWLSIFSQSMAALCNMSSQS